MREDPLDDKRIMDGGNQPHPASAVGTRQDIDRERALHQRRPGPPAGRRLLRRAAPLWHW